MNHCDIIRIVHDQQLPQDLIRIYQVKADILNPFSVMKSLNSVIQETSFFNLDPVIDLSAGATFANIGIASLV